MINYRTTNDRYKWAVWKSPRLTYDEVWVWCFNNLGPMDDDRWRYAFMGWWEFYSEEDAVMFKMVWC